MLIECDGYRTEAAEHVVASEFPVEHIEVPHAVEQRDDRRLRSHRRRKRTDRVLEIERLAAQQDDVEFLGNFVRLQRRRIFQRHVAVRALDHKAGGSQFDSAPGAD